jgi:hypothetical protein
MVTPAPARCRHDHESTPRGATGMPTALMKINAYFQQFIEGRQSVRADAARHEQPAIRQVFPGRPCAIGGGDPRAMSSIWVSPKHPKTGEQDDQKKRKI